MSQKVRLYIEIVQRQLNETLKILWEKIWYIKFSSWLQTTMFLLCLRLFYNNFVLTSVSGYFIITIFLLCFRLFANLEFSVNISCRDESYPENPINVLHLLNRYIHIWPSIPDIVLCNSCAIFDRERGTSIKFI